MDTNDYPYMSSMYASASKIKKLVHIEEVSNGDKLYVSFDYNRESDLIGDVEVKYYCKKKASFTDVTELFNKGEFYSTIDTIISNTINNQ